MQITRRTFIFHFNACQRYFQRTQPSFLAEKLRWETATAEIACSSMKTFTLRAALGCCLETPTETNLGVTARSGKCGYGKSNYTNNEEYVRFQPLSSDKANASLVTSLYDTLFASASIDGQIKSKIEEDVFVHDIVSKHSLRLCKCKNEETLTTKTCLKTVLQGTSVITPCFRFPGTWSSVFANLG